VVLPQPVPPAIPIINMWFRFVSKIQIWDDIYPVNCLPFYYCINKRSNLLKI
jgi:hypothetical protein